MYDDGKHSDILASNLNRASSTTRCRAKAGKNWRKQEDKMVKDGG